MNDASEIEQIIASALSRVRISGKCGERVLKPTIARALSAANFEADVEDRLGLFPHSMSAWRSKETGLVEGSRGRRRIDIVVRRNDVPVALIETESDLNDLKRSGVTRRNGHYDVFSIARSEKGDFFDSYKSVERMATAAFHHWVAATTGHAAFDVVAALENVRSRTPVDHNPAGLPIFLVTGTCRLMDREILEERLQSLGAKLLSALNEPPWGHNVE